METKTCTKCSETKSLDRFQLRMTTTGKRPRGKCKDCRNEELREARDDTRRKYEREWKRSGRRTPTNKQTKTADDVLQQNRAWWFRTNYGITLDDYNQMLSQQDGACAICLKHPDIEHAQKRFRVLHVDHCHNSDKVRGLLCASCNLALGAFQDDPNLLERATKYLLDNAERIP